ncbi:uncharacterized protein LOC134178641 [Corticium candelabrum]|uniref:uncharacterized protein LOC134178641 n=1 Tax=Corticium candelabrum TaxID=121492 RepID=UPI002E264E5B|nr:uncharacterized protein LOC134178641 [Corticium candelabrum]
MTLVAVFVELFCDSYNIILLIGSDSDYDSPNELSASVPVVSDKAVNTTVSTGVQKLEVSRHSGRGTGRGLGRGVVVESLRAPGVGRGGVNPVDASVVSAVPDAYGKQQLKQSPKIVHRQQTIVTHTKSLTPPPTNLATGGMTSKPVMLGRGLPVPSVSRAPPPGFGHVAQNSASAAGQEFSTRTSSVLQQEPQEYRYSVISVPPSNMPFHQPWSQEPIFRAQQLHGNFNFTDMSANVSVTGSVVGFGRGGGPVPSWNSLQLGGQQKHSVQSPHVTILAEEPEDKQIWLHECVERENSEALATKDENKRKIRKLQKLLNQISVLEEKKHKGDQLDTDQRTKLARKRQLEEELQALER